MFCNTFLIAPLEHSEDPSVTLARNSFFDHKGIALVIFEFSPQEAEFKMIVIFAENVGTELEEQVNELADQFGRARTPDERDRISEKVYALVGNNFKSMLGNASKGFRLPSQELEALAWQGLLEALSNSGISRLKRSDGVWETFIQQCLHSDQPAAKRVWNGLSPDLRKTLETTVYLKSTICDALVKELNALVRRPDLYNANAWAGVTLKDEARVLLHKGIPNLSATELSRLNLLLMASAFPEIKAEAAPPERNLIGYFAKFFMPKAKSEMAEMAGAQPMSEYMIEARNIIQPIIEELTQLEAAGKLPPNLARLGLAERIYTRQRERLQVRYGPVIQWLNGQIKALQPQNPFAVNSPSALRAARQLLESNNVPERLWKEKGSPNYLPVSALEPIGVGTIKRVLEIGSPKKQDTRRQPEKPAQSAPSSGDSQAVYLLYGGHQAPAFRYLIENLFDENQAERSVGMFLAGNPRPNKAEVEQFMGSLPDDMVDDVESVGGWDRMVYQIDQQVLNQVRDPQSRAEIVRALELEPSEVMAATDRIRRIIFGRTTNMILRLPAA